MGRFRVAAAVVVRLREDEPELVVIDILRLHRFEGLLDGRDERLGVITFFLREGFGRRVVVALGLALRGQGWAARVDGV